MCAACVAKGKRMNSIPSRTRGGDVFRYLDAVVVARPLVKPSIMARKHHRSETVAWCGVLEVECQICALGFVVVFGEVIPFHFTKHGNALGRLDGSGDLIPRGHDVARKRNAVRPVQAEPINTNVGDIVRPRGHPPFHERWVCVVVVCHQPFPRCGAIWIRCVKEIIAVCGDKRVGYTFGNFEGHLGAVGRRGSNTGYLACGVDKCTKCDPMCDDIQKHFDARFVECCDKVFEIGFRAQTWVQHIRSFRSVHAPDGKEMCVCFTIPSQPHRSDTQGIEIRYFLFEGLKCARTTTGNASTIGRGEPTWGNFVHDEVLCPIWWWYRWSCPIRWAFRVIAYPLLIGVFVHTQNDGCTTTNELPFPNYTFRCFERKGYISVSIGCAAFSLAIFVVRGAHQRD
eukprot:m.569035 g.569035  ORF g.569035 m.569035 type:complete len:398 (-) comp22258_c0_seq6:1398-2591(-)